MDWQAIPGAGDHSGGGEGNTTLEEMYKEFELYPTSNFAAFRTIVQSTSSIIDCAKEFEAYANAKNDGYTYKYVDTYTLFDLIRQSGQGAQVSGE